LDLKLPSQRGGLFERAGLEGREIHVFERDTKPFHQAREIRSKRCPKGGVGGKVALCITGRGFDEGGEN